MLGLIIPSSATGGAGDFGGFDIPSDHHASARPSSRLRSLLEDEDEGFNLDPGFAIDAEGNVVLTGQDQPQQTPAAIGARIGSESAASGRVRRELEEGRQVAQLDVSGKAVVGCTILMFSSWLGPWTSTWTYRHLATMS